MIEQGWQCPICKRVYNPRQEMCLYCGGTQDEKVSRDTMKIYWNTVATTTSGATTCPSIKEGENYATNR